MRGALCLALLTLSASPALCAAGAYNPAAIAGAIGPFVDEQALLIIRADLSRLDGKAVQARWQELINWADADPRAAEALAPMLRWIGEFAAAGGREVYLIVSTLDLLAAPPYGVAPLSPEAKPERLRELLMHRERPPGPAALPNMMAPLPVGPQVEVLRDAIVWGTKEQAQRVRTATPIYRPEVATALAAAGTADVQALFLPTADSLRVIEEILPQLPPVLGGGPSTVLTRGIRWATLSVDGPPKMAVRLIVQSQDAAAAKALHEHMPKLTKGLLDAAVAVQKGKPEQPNLEPLIRALTPAVQGDRLTLTLDDRQVNDLARQALAPLLRGSREAYGRMEAAARMRAISAAIFQYAKDHNGQWPPDLETLVKEGRMERSVLANPRRPDMSEAFVYVRPKAPSQGLPPDTLILYEAHTAWGDGINVLYADGHVAFITDEARFKRELAATGRRLIHPLALHGPQNEENRK